MLQIQIALFKIWPSVYTNLLLVLCVFSPQQMGDALIECLTDSKLGPGAVVNVTFDGLKVVHYKSS